LENHGQNNKRNDIGEELKYEEIIKEFGKEEAFGLEEWHYVWCPILFSMFFFVSAFPSMPCCMFWDCLLQNLSSVRS